MKNSRRGFFGCLLASAVALIAAGKPVKRYGRIDATVHPCPFGTVWLNGEDVTRHCVACDDSAGYVDLRRIKHLPTGQTFIVFKRNVGTDLFAPPPDGAVEIDSGNEHTLLDRHFGQVRFEFIGKRCEQIHNDWIASGRPPARLVTYKCQ